MWGKPGFVTTILEVGAQLPVETRDPKLAHLPQAVDLRPGSLPSPPAMDPELQNSRARWPPRGPLTVIWTASRPSPASLASMVNSTGRLAGTPVVLSPGPLALTLLASCVGSTLTLKGLSGQDVVDG